MCITRRNNRTFSGRVLRVNKKINIMRLNRDRLCRFFFLLCPLFFSAYARAQVVTIPVETRTNALVLQADEQKNLSIIYFGEKLLDASEYAKTASMHKPSSDYSAVLNAAYTPSGSRNLAEPAITVVHADGNTSLDLRYVSHATEAISDGVSLLSVTLKDPVYAFQVVL
jgi:alpha-galactosidase